MHCPTCSVETVVFAVPSDLREYAPTSADTASLCPHCLRVEAVEDDVGVDNSSFDTVSTSFPRGEAGVSMALLVGLLDSLALNRRDIELLAARAESHGVDVLLTLDRLTVDVADPHFDIERRLVQLQQILD